MLFWLATTLGDRKSDHTFLAYTQSAHNRLANRTILAHTQLVYVFCVFSNCCYCTTSQTLTTPWLIARLEVADPLCAFPCCCRYVSGQVVTRKGCCLWKWYCWVKRWLNTIHNPLRASQGCCDWRNSALGWLQLAHHQNAHSVLC